eukprot:Nitzschia sp. Nitz4//scaffold2_size372955//35307//36075//NITZ4_000362-RA/size372955-snap-gene-0.4-mRNA-1//1//CDS//3329546593//8125//frame0
MSDTADVPTWVKLCGNCAPLAAFIVCLAPFPTIKQITRDRSTGSFPLLPYTAMFCNGFLCFVYGVLKGELRLSVTNFVGMGMAMYFILKFVRYAPAKSPTLPGSVRQHVNVASSVVVGTLLLVGFAPFGDPAPIIGRMSVLFCVSMFGGPLTALKTVLQTKSAKSIPLPFTLATILNCILWSVLGIFELHDFNVYFPNVVGLMFGVAQVTLKLIFGEGPSSKEEEGLSLIL